MEIHKRNLSLTNTLHSSRIRYKVVEKKYNEILLRFWSDARAEQRMVHAAGQARAGAAAAGAKEKEASSSRAN